MSIEEIVKSLDEQILPIVANYTPEEFLAFNQGMLMVIQLIEVCAIEGTPDKEKDKVSKEFKKMEQDLINAALNVVR